MKYMLDTDFCIYLMKGPAPAVVKKLARMKPKSLGVSAITHAELRFGADKSKKKEANHAALDVFFDNLETIAFDDEAALHYGRIRASLENEGKPIGPLDTLIAANAMSHGAILVTHNTKEFKRVRKLKVEDWIE